MKGKIHGVGELFESEDEETEYIDYVLTVKEKLVMSVTENKFPKRIFAHMVLRWLDTVFKNNGNYDLDPYFYKIITCLKIKSTFVM